MRGADVLAQVLSESGQDTVFSLSGNQILPIFDAFLEPGIRLIHTRHEAAAAFMAEGHAQVTGKPGIALVTAGSGLANALTPLITARASQTPLVLLTGDSPVRDDGRGAFQEMPQTAITAPVTKWSVRVEDSDEIAEIMLAALDRAHEGQPGPVHVALPVDILEAKSIAPSPVSPHPQPESTTGFDILRETLGSADRPLIVLGPALSRSQSSLEFGRLCAPALAMESPRGANDPALGRSKAAWREADLVVALGKPIDFSVGFGAKPLWPNARWITVHGDSREVDRARRNLGDRLIEAFHSSPRRVAEALVSAERVGKRRDEWCDRVARWREARIHAPDAGGVLTSPLVCSAVQAYLDGCRNPIVICDGGEFGQWAQALTNAPLRIINGVSGTIGGGTCYAIGAKVAAPESDVLVLMGDGTAGFHFLEFETAAREAIPFIAVIGNDQRWSAEHELQRRNYGEDRTFACTLSGARYDLAAAALGAFGAHVTRPEQLPQALRDARTSGRPACINVDMTGLPAPSF
ncbi:MAG: thiamine pyrophosphate-binding protein [Paracoccaceae bacterium]|nr:thiamine pyrophosphate-binding protein [Paracoccaceae bacterium]